MSFSPGAPKAPGVSIVVCVHLETQVPVRGSGIYEYEIQKGNFAGLQICIHIAKLQATI